MARITPEMPQRGASRNLIQVIDNYYRPARDRVGEAAMAQGFRDVSNFFGNEAAKAKKQQLDELAKQGAADAMAGLDPNEELAQVRKGLLFRSNSQAYNQAYNETMGKKAAIEFKEKATLDYEKSGMKYDTDPNRFREWMNERVHNFLTDPAHNNPYFLAGAMGYVENTTFNMGAAHQANISAQMERNHLAAIQKDADDIALKISTGEMTIEAGIDALAGLNNQAYGTGFSGPKARAALLASYLSVADATDNLAMIEALTAAQESGKLRLTPQEWNNITKEGQGIERDIKFRQDQRDRAAKAQAEAEENTVTDIVADFYNNPANAAVPFQTFLQAPVGDTGQTMADIINASPNTDALMKKAKDAYTTINSIYDIPQSQESMNNLALDAAFENNEIQSPAQLMDWFKAAQADGLRFNENNWKHAEQLMRKFNDPEEPHSTQTYKDYKKSAVNRAIKALTIDEDDLSKTLYGDYQGGMSETINMMFQGYLDDHLAALPAGKRNDPDLIKEAIRKAEESVYEYFKKNDPEYFNKALNNFEQAVESVNTSPIENRYLTNEINLRIQEQAALDAERDLQHSVDALMDHKFNTRDDIKTQASLNEQKAIKARAEAAEQGFITPTIGATEINQPKVRNAQPKSSVDLEAMIKGNGEAIEQTKEIVTEVVQPNIDYNAILNDLQRKYGFELPKTYGDVAKLANVLAGITDVNPDDIEMLLQAAMESMRQ